MGFFCHSILSGTKNIFRTAFVGLGNIHIRLREQVLAVDEHLNILKTRIIKENLLGTSFS